MSDDVFISYKRKTAAAQARLIRTHLLQHGLRVFMDVTDLGSGFFDESLLNRIAETRNFILILAPHALDHCMNERDWLRREVRQAITLRRNIIPVGLRGFQFPKELPEDIRDLPRDQGVEYSHEFFEAMMEKIVDLLQTDAPIKREITNEKLPSPKKSFFAWWLVAAIFFAFGAAGIFVLRFEHGNSSDAKLLKLFAATRQDFADAVSSPVAARQPHTTAVQNDIDAILRLYPNNGLAIYYRGELKRLE
jgi:hypothetical protein